MAAGATRMPRHRVDGKVQDAIPRAPCPKMRLPRSRPLALAHCDSAAHGAPQYCSRLKRRVRSRAIAVGDIEAGGGDLVLDGFLRSVMPNPVGVDGLASASSATLKRIG